MAPVSLAPTALEQVLLERINDQRQDRGLTPLAMDARMQQVAVRSAELAWEAKHVSKVKTLLTKAKVPWEKKDSITAGLSGSATSVGTSPAELTRMAEELAVDHPLTFSFDAAKYNRHRMVGIVVFRPDDPRSLFGLTTTSDVTASIKGRLPIVTGVAYRDANSNGLYDAGEGLTGVRVQVAGPRLKPVSVQAWDTGGFSLPVKAKKAITVTVTASGGDLAAPLAQTVQLRPGANTRVNFVLPPA